MSEEELEHLLHRLEAVTLDYPLSPYHRQRGRVVDVTRMRDGAVVFTVEWSDGTRLS